MTLLTLDELATDRVRRALNRPGAYVTDEGAERYALRVQRDRRRPPALVFDLVVFRALLESPGLGGRSEGGWRPLRKWVEPEAQPGPGRSGEVVVEQTVAEDGRIVVRHANRSVSALQWLAARKDAAGRPWLTPAQVAAAERLKNDHRLAGSIGRLTMDWSLAPRSGSFAATYDDPSQAAMDARRRVAVALRALSPEGKWIVEKICFEDLSLREVEIASNAITRSARALLQAALEVLSTRYRES